MISRSVTDADHPPERPPQPSPVVAAFLSLLVPGLGQVAAGRRLRGLLLALPLVLLVAAAAALVTRGRIQAAALLVSPGVIEAILAINLMLLVWHAWAVSDAARIARRRRGRPFSRPAKATVAALIAITIVGHGVLEVVGYQARDTIATVFGQSDANGDWTIPSPSFDATAPSSPSPTVPGETPGPTPVPTPAVTPGPAWAADGRLNILLIGGDAGPGRWSLRTDSMEILSVDVATGRAALFGLPRNLVNVPLPPESAAAFPGGTYPDLLNSLYVYANDHPSQFPGGDARGFRAISGAIQQLIGVPLDGAVVVNLNGFVRLVDAIGGLWIDVPEAVYDSHYPLENGTANVQLYIKAGCQRLSGHFALAYARSRHMDSDYGRMERQQRTLVALANQVDPLALVPKVPDLLAIAKDDLWTTFSPSDVGPLAELLTGVDARAARQFLFVPPQIPVYLDKASIAQIRETVADVFAAPYTPPPPRPYPTVAPTAASRCG